MSEETGLGADAARTRETALAQTVRVPAGADRRVVPTLQGAYEAAVRGRRQLDVIGADIESAVTNHEALALETPAGAATFSRFLAARTQAINRVVAETTAEARAGAAALESLGPSYQAVGFGPKPEEPPPAPVPFPPYQPKVWGACRASKLVDVTRDIGRTVGCSAYRNDLTPPDVPEEWRNQPVGWYTEGLPPYIPGLSDPKG